MLNILQKPAVTKSAVHEIEVEPISVGHSGQMWRVTHGGEVLIETCRDPEHDACRALLALGITGMLRTRIKGALFPGMVLDIERGALMRTTNSAKQPLRIGKWQPFDRPDLE